MNYFIDFFVSYNEWLNNSHPFVDMFVLATAITLTQLTAHPFNQVTRLKVIAYNIFFTFLFWILTAALLPVLPLLIVVGLPFVALFGIFVAVKRLFKKS